MPARKRNREELELPSVDVTVPAPQQTLLSRLRNMWEFANLMQYIFIFGKAVKISEDFDIEDLETECMTPGPNLKLAEIGLAMLKVVSSHRGLSPDLFDEYTRRQYLAKAPDRNPFGDEEEPNKFKEMDIFTKLRVLWQLSQWTFTNPNHIRERMEEVKEADQAQWRMEELGYDKDERLYFVLDDNRLYRRTDPALPPTPKIEPKIKAKAKPKGKGKEMPKPRQGVRSSKRRRTGDGYVSEEEVAQQEKEVKEDTSEDVEMKESEKDIEEDTFGGMKWECIAVTLAEYQDFLASIQKSRDADEKVLHKRLTNDVLPVIEKLEETQQKKIARRQRELEIMEKNALAKRSSRIANKQDREREEREAAEAERKRQEALKEARKDAERQKQMEVARESRMMTREQRLKDREYKRLLREEELANLSEDSKKLEAGEGRISERHLKAEMEKKKRELEELQEEDEWFFDCAKCGVHGENIDDGSHSIACERCNVWQHSVCLGVSQEEAEKDDFHFICADCIRKEEDAKKPKLPTLKFKIGPSASPPQKKRKSTDEPNAPAKKRKSTETPGDGVPKKRGRPRKIKSEGEANGNGVFTQYSPPRGTPQGLNGYGAPNYSPAQNATAAMQQSIMNGPTLSPYGQNLPQGANGRPLPPPGLMSPQRPAQNTNGFHAYQPPMANTGAFGHPQLQRQKVGGSPPAAGAFQQSPYAQQSPGMYSTPYSGSYYDSLNQPPPNPLTLAQAYSSPFNRPAAAAQPPLYKFAPPQTPSAAAPSTLSGPNPSQAPSPFQPNSLANSPRIAPPPQSVASASKPGISPEKHDSPRPPSSTFGSAQKLSMEIPLAAHLSPTVTKVNLHPPVKGLTPEHGPTSNLGSTSFQVQSFLPPPVITKPLNGEVEGPIAAAAISDIAPPVAKVDGLIGVANDAVTQQPNTVPDVPKIVNGGQHTNGHT